MRQNGNGTERACMFPRTSLKYESELSLKMEFKLISGLHFPDKANADGLVVRFCKWLTQNLPAGLTVPFLLLVDKEKDNSHTFHIKFQASKL